MKRKLMALVLAAGLAAEQQCRRLRQTQKRQMDAHIQSL